MSVARSSFQEALLAELYDLQRRYRAGDWHFDSTMWSRASHALAKQAGKLRPSPVRGKPNVERTFEERFKRAMEKLVQAGLVERRSVKAADAPAAFAVGYKRNRARDRDVFLTAEGLAAAEDVLRRQGLMCEPGLSSCLELPDPTGPTPSGLAGCDE